MPRDKYEDEIREILNRMDNFVPEGGQRERPRRQAPPPWSHWMSDLRRRLYGYNSTSFLVGFIMLALAAGLLHRIYAPFGLLTALLSVGCLVAALVLPFFSQRYGRPEQRWRGRIIELDSYRPRQPFSWRRTWWRIKTFFGFR